MNSIRAASSHSSCSGKGVWRIEPVGGTNELDQTPATAPRVLPDSDARSSDSSPTPATPETPANAEPMPATPDDDTDEDDDEDDDDEHGVTGLPNVL